MHNHDADTEACLNRQTLNNSVIRKAMEDLCKRTRRLIHKEPRSQYLDTRTYKDIRNISTETNGCDDQTIRIYTDGSKGE